MTVAAENNSTLPPSWDRFVADPRQAFVFASAYEMIWGEPIGDGENADGVVAAASTWCTVAAASSWDEVEDSLNGTVEDPDKWLLTAQVFCPEVTD